MSAAITDVAHPRKAAPDWVAEQLIEQARVGGPGWSGSPLAALTQQVLETGFEAELDEHLGYEHSEWPGKLATDRGENERNGSRTKTVWTELGPVEIGNAIVPDCRFAAQPTLRPCGGRS